MRSARSSRPPVAIAVRRRVEFFQAIEVSMAVKRAKSPAKKASSRAPAKKSVAAPPKAKAAKPKAAARPVPKPAKVTKPAPASLASVVAAALDDMKAVNPAVLDVRGLTDIADTLVVASGNSDRHVRSIADR